MTAASISIGSPSRLTAQKILGATGWFWMVVAIIGQLIFAVSVAAGYGSAAGRGNFAAWNRGGMTGYVPGEHVLNSAVGIHLAMAVLIITSGAIQFVPVIRRRLPVLHRWNGRFYMVAAFAVSTAGIFLMWTRGVPGDVSQHIGTTLNGVAIMICAAQTLRYALARKFEIHRRWAVRLFLVVAGVWFFRLGVTLSFMLFQGPVGFDETTFVGPFLTFMTFAQFLLPVGVFELYSRIKEQRLPALSAAMAIIMVLLTLATSAGIAGASAGMWLPTIKSAFDPRISIAQTLSETIVANGIDAAIEQYQKLKTAGGGKYNFDEDELNVLGYQLIRKKRLADAVRIFQMNVAAYPQSANAHDSLAEGYMDEGDTAQAIAGYRETLLLNPKSSNAVRMLKKLNAGDPS